MSSCTCESQLSNTALSSRCSILATAFCRTDLSRTLSAAVACHCVQQLAIAMFCMRSRQLLSLPLSAFPSATVSAHASNAAPSARLNSRPTAAFTLSRRAIFS